MRTAATLETRERTSNSCYYPPRARWYRPRFYIAGFLRRKFLGPARSEPLELTLLPLFAGLLVPGWAFKLRRPRTFGRAALLICALLVTIFFIWIGYPASSVAFGLLLSLHVTGVNYLLEPVLRNTRFGFRIMFCLSWFAVLTVLVYVPVRNLIEHRWFVPLRVNEQVIVVNRMASAREVKRGDWIAYSIAGDAAPGIVVEAGYGLGAVLAMPGDRVRFTKSSFEVNGLARQRLETMPRDGELVVAEKHWFVWPEFDRMGHGHVEESQISAMLLQMAMISEDQFAGKPFKRWFWRRQHVS